MLPLVAVLLAVGTAQALAPSSKTVNVGDAYFSAKKLTVSKGARVTWNWIGFLNHNVTVTNGPVKFHSKTQVRGTFSHQFTRRGVYHLVCTIHPFMKMTILVR